MIFIIYLGVCALLIWALPENKRLIAGALLFGVLLIFFPYKSLDDKYILGYRIDTDEYHLLGDFVGGIASTYFSGIAVYLLYLTYDTQKKELLATKKELRNQSSISSFFNMLATLDAIVQQLRMTVPVNVDNITTSISLSGREVFSRSYDDLKSEINGPQGEGYYYKYDKDSDVFQTIIGDPSNPSGKKTVGELRSIKEYQSTYGTPTISVYFKSGGQIFKHYFRYVESLLDFIADSFDDDERSKRIKMLTAQLSHDELAMIFFFSILPENEKFETRIVKHNFLQDFDFTYMPVGDHRIIYLSKINTK